MSSSSASHAKVTESNRAVILEFADSLYRRHDVRRAFENYVVPDYVQHNPGIIDGREAAVAFLEPMFSRSDATFEIKRIIVDGDLAVIHLFGRGDSNTRGAAVCDIYRLENGKIVEHWDVIQPVPESARNPHPLF